MGNTAFLKILRGGIRVQACGCVNSIRLWPLRRDDHSGVLIGAGVMRRSDWSARVLTNDVITRINRQVERDERSIRCGQRQMATSFYKPPAARVGRRLEQTKWLGCS